MTTTAAELPTQRRPALHRWEFDVLRVLAILGVVAIHVFGLVFTVPELRGTPTWVLASVLDIGSNWCVPLFVMISGALLLGPAAHRDGPGTFLRKRAVRLLPAVVVWHLVYLLLVRKVILGADLEPSVVALNLIDGKVYTALYFLWLILGLYVVAPVLAAFLAGGGERRAQVAAVIGCLWGAANVVLPIVATQLGYPRARIDTAVTMWVPYVGLFLAGYAWRRPRTSGWRWLVALVVAIALLAFDVWSFNVAPDHAWLRALLPVHYVSLPTVGAAIGIFICAIDLAGRIDLPRRAVRVLAALGSATFGVFLVHLVLVALCRRWWPEFYADPAPVAKAELYAAVVVLSFAISLVAARIPVVRRVF